MSEQHLFAIGEKVNWTSAPDRQLSMKVLKFRLKYGDGPFEVVDVKDVPTQCDCGTIKNKHPRSCGIYRVEYYGHPQSVAIISTGEEQTEERIGLHGVYFELVP